MDHELIPIEAAAGRVCAEYVTAYPPGIPLLVPGEAITARIVTAAGRGESLMKSKSKGKGGQIAVLKAVSEL
jgi:arginine/lysine/ornithine decarboxylase